MKTRHSARQNRAVVRATAEERGASTTWEPTCPVLPRARPQPQLRPPCRHRSLSCLRTFDGLEWPKFSQKNFQTKTKQGTGTRQAPWVHEPPSPTRSHALQAVPGQTFDVSLRHPYTSVPIII